MFTHLINKKTGVIPDKLTKYALPQWEYGAEKQTFSPFHSPTTTTTTYTNSLNGGN